MNTLEIEFNALAHKVYFSEDALHIILLDDREVAAPIQWFPRLLAATEKQKQHWRLIGHGVGIHWPDIDEDISIKTLLTTR